MHWREPWSHGRPGRLPGWDYAGDGCYFITLVADKRRRVFGTLTPDGVRLSETGRVVQEALDATPAKRPEVTLDTSVIMPDHLHAILFLTRTRSIDPSGDVLPLRRPARSLGSLIAQFKAVTTHAARSLIGAHEGRLWQKGYYDRIVRGERDLNAYRRYIIENPIRALSAR